MPVAQSGLRKMALCLSQTGASPRISIEAYRRLAGRQESILDLLADPEAADVAFEPDRLGRFTRPADLS